MTHTLSTILYAAMAGITVFALAGALVQQDRRRDQVASLATLLLALLAHALGELVMAAELYRAAPHLAGAEIPLRMALGPALYLYVRSLVSPEPVRFGGRDWFAFAGPALLLLICLPFLMLSAEEKLALADPLTRDPAHFRLALLACTAGMLMFLAFTIAYLAAAVRLQGRHRASVMQEYANIERRSLDWLRVVLVVWSIAWLVYAVDRMLGFVGASSPPLSLGLALLETAALGAFAHLALHQPQPAKETHDADPVRAAILPNDRMERVAARLTAVLSANRFFADPDLSLTKLSEATGITKNHISETLSQHLGTNFFDFVNSHRIAEAQRLIADTDATVLEIAMDVGFNARSTFNTAFKKHTGATPSAYRKSVRDVGVAAAAEKTGVVAAPVMSE